METLEKELDTFVAKLKDSGDFLSEIDRIQNFYPFNRYEYIITKLVDEKILTYDEYLDLRNDYINRNLFYMYSRFPHLAVLVIHGDSAICFPLSQS